MLDCYARCWRFELVSRPALIWTKLIPLCSRLLCQWLDVFIFMNKGCNAITPIATYRHGYAWYVTWLKTHSVFLARKTLNEETRDQMGPKEVTNLKLRRKNRVEISKFINLHVQKVVIFFLTQHENHWKLFGQEAVFCKTYSKGRVELQIFSCLILYFFAPMYVPSTLPPHFYPSWLDVNH